MTLSKEDEMGVACSKHRTDDKFVEHSGCKT
jgi:hypothetical protein